MGYLPRNKTTEERAGSAKSVFHFDVQGSVAKSTHAGIPWLRFIRLRLGDRVHFWPFDGWEIPAARSAIAEVYPALWSRSFAREGRDGDQHDAYYIAAWLSRADRSGTAELALYRETRKLPRYQHSYCRLLPVPQDILRKCGGSALEKRFKISRLRVPY